MRRGRKKRIGKIKSWRELVRRGRNSSAELVYIVNERRTDGLVGGLTEGGKRNDASDRRIDEALTFALVLR